MLSFEEAKRRCGSIPAKQRQETVSARDANGRRLYEPLIAMHPSPRWNNSAMDGYAFDMTEWLATKSELEVIEVIPAGKAAKKTVRQGQCAKIMTGAPMPQGADTVVIKENVERLSSGRIRILHVPKPGQNVRLAGEEFQEGDEIAAKDQIVNPGLIGLCASQNIPSLSVYAAPVIGIIATGDELATQDMPLKPGQIWSSNTVALMAAIQQSGAIAIDGGIARDNIKSVKAAYQKCLTANCDLIISTGGVSVGDFDVVKEAMEDVGAQLDFWKVKIKPGKPLAVGHIADTPVFGLPGNPVSCLVSFHQFVKPWIKKCLGAINWAPEIRKARLVEGYQKKHGRTEFVRVFCWQENGEWLCKSTGNQSSAWLRSMAYGNGFMKVQHDASGINAGEVVPIELLN